jgi:hypothetical protein
MATDKQIQSAIEKLTKGLSKIKHKGKLVGFTLIVRKDEITVACGWDFPDTIASKVSNLRAKIKSIDVSCAADSVGGVILKTIYINGGKSDSRFSRY